MLEEIGLLTEVRTDILGPQPFLKEEAPPDGDPHLPEKSCLGDAYMGGPTRDRSRFC